MPVFGNFPMALGPTWAQTASSLMGRAHFLLTSQACSVQLRSKQLLSNGMQANNAGRRSTQSIPQPQASEAQNQHRSHDFAQLPRIKDGCSSPIQQVQPGATPQYVLAEHTTPRHIHNAHANMRNADTPYTIVTIESRLLSATRAPEYVWPESRCCSCCCCCCACACACRAPSVPMAATSGLAKQPGLLWALPLQGLLLSQTAD